MLERLYEIGFQCVSLGKTIQKTNAMKAIVFVNPIRLNAFLSGKEKDLAALDHKEGPHYTLKVELDLADNRYRFEFGSNYSTISLA